jgi:hypothetical protein
MKTVAEVIGVSRSNLIERMRDPEPNGSKVGNASFPNQQRPGQCPLEKSIRLARRLLLPPRRTSGRTENVTRLTEAQKNSATNRQHGREHP